MSVALRTRTVQPASRGLRGALAVPGDKSIAHRAVLFAALAAGTSEVRGMPAGRDNRATVAACRALGVTIVEDGDVCTIAGGGWEGLRAPAATIECENSGTTMRLLAGVLAARPFTSRLDGDASLRRRPMRRIIEPLAAMGAVIASEGADGRAPLRIEGRALHGAAHVLPVASAQVKSALLLAGLQARGRTRVAEPARSRDHGERLLGAFGARVESGRCWVAVDGPQELRATRVVLPGDVSSALFLVVAALLVPDSEVRIDGVGLNPTRTGALDVLAAMGGRLDVTPGRGDAEPVGTIVARSSALHGTHVAGELLLRAIDEFPILCVAAACAEGTTEFRDAAELRVKESDRVAAMRDLLRGLGATVDERPDGLVITGPARLHGGRVATHGDHRIAMAAAVAGLAASAPVAITDADCAEVSFPGFYAALERLRQ